MKRILTVAVLSLLAFPALAQHKGMDMKPQASNAVHKATGIVTRVDAANNKATIRHDPVPSLNWPTMNMVFAVRDKALMQKLAKDRKIEFEFTQDGKEFVVTSVK